MRLNLREIIVTPGAVLPFAFQLDLSDQEFGGEHPICEPVRVTGQVCNRAGALELQAEAATNLHLTCDRCAAPFVREKKLSYETLLATELEDEENDEILLLDGDELDVGEAVATAFILGMDTKKLCSEDCKGLCASCGANLNEGPCRCKPAADPRLAVLAQLLDK